jgi:hypothetical protein
MYFDFSSKTFTKIPTKSATNLNFPGNPAQFRQKRKHEESEFHDDFPLKIRVRDIKKFW